MSLAPETRRNGSALVLSCDALYRYTCLTVVAFSSFDRGRDVFSPPPSLRVTLCLLPRVYTQVSGITGDTPFTPLCMNELSEDGLWGWAEASCH